MTRRQRLLIVLPHLEVGGAQRVAVNLANYWVQQGHVVKLLTTLEHKTVFYQLDERIERLILKKPAARVGPQKLGLVANIEKLLTVQLLILQASRRCSAASDPRPRGRFLTAAQAFIATRPPLPQSMNAMLYLPRRIWSELHPLGEPLRLRGIRTRLLFFSILILRTTHVATLVLRGAVWRTRKSIANLRTRVATGGLRFSRLTRQPKLLTQLLRMSVWRVGALRNALQIVQPDVVLSFLSTTNMIAVAAGYGLPFRVVISERNDPARQELQQPWQRLRPHIYPLADLVTANSHGALEELANYCPSAKLAYVANPIVVTSTPSYAHRRCSILFLARLVEQKAPDILVEAFAEFSQEHPDWSLEIAGDGPMESELRELVCALGIEAKVKFHGMVKDPTDLLATSRIFALPSRFEGTPNSLLEAMASGLACIVSDASPGPLRLVEHERCGLVVTTDDPHALAKALSRLAEDLDLQVRLGIAARERTREFLLDNVAREWERLIFPDNQNERGRSDRG